MNDNRWDHLKKYLPFLDFLLQQDLCCKKKFETIREWIVTNRRVSPTVVSKSEESIIVQYEQMFLNSKNPLPKRIAEIFRRDPPLVVATQFATVSLVSEDEKSSDDDIEIVSISKARKPLISDLDTNKKYDCENDAFMTTMESYMVQIKENKTKSEEDTLTVEPIPAFISDVAVRKRVDLNPKVKRSFPLRNEKHPNLRMEMNKTGRFSAQSLRKKDNPVRQNIRLNDTNYELESADAENIYDDMDPEELRAIYEGLIYNKDVDLKKNGNKPCTEVSEKDLITQPQRKTVPSQQIKYTSPINPDFGQITSLNQSMSMVTGQLPNHYTLNSVSPYIVNNYTPLSSNSVPQYLSPMPMVQIPVQTSLPRAVPQQYNSYNRNAQYCQAQTSENTNQTSCKQQQNDLKTSPTITLENGVVLNLKDPRIMKNFEKWYNDNCKRNKNVEPVQSKTSQSAVTYGEYKRLRDQEEKKLKQEEELKKTITEMNSAKSSSTSKTKDLVKNPTLVHEKQNQSLPKQKNKIDRVTRELKSLECTLKGFTNMENQDLPIIYRKRRASVCAQSAITKLLQADNVGNDKEESLSDSETISSKKARNLISVQNKDENIFVSNVSTFEDTYTVSKNDVCRTMNGKQINSQAINVGPHFSEKEIIKHQKENRDPVAQYKDNQNIIDVQLVAQSSINADSYIEPTKKKKGKLCIVDLNIDCNMTAINTVFCKICKSKPRNLTNHFISVHRTESYVSRLSTEELDTLEQNIPFAEPVTSNTLSSTTKYKLECFFCKLVITETFINFYKHFSTHTGEYGFKCSRCHVRKPYGKDIRRHMTTAKKCQNAIVQVQYLYKKDLMVIQLYCCKICGFVQLNTANIFKHLRDHHQKLNDDPSCLKKYVVAAIKDGEVIERDSEEVSSVGDVRLSPEAVYEELRISDIAGSVEFEESSPCDNDLTNFSEMGVFYNDDTNDVAVQPNNTITVTHIHSQNEEKELRSMNPKYTSKVLQDDVKPDIEQLQSFNENIKGEFLKVTSGKKSTNQENTPNRLWKASLRDVYKTYTNHTSFYGLLKCMAFDCTFSTNVDEEMLTHITDHVKSDNPPEGIFECAYCLWHKFGRFESADILIKHVRNEHGRSRFQCSNCSYRSCLVRNVEIHKRYAHSLQCISNVVYDCESTDCENSLTATNDDLLNIQDAMHNNVLKLMCSICSESFYALKNLKKHTDEVHKHAQIEVDGKYTCIYCAENMNELIKIEEHLAMKHPDDFGYICERILKPGHEVDDVRNLTLTQLTADISSSVNVVRKGSTEVIVDSKPNIEELHRSSVEAVKPLLLKLTQNTGVAPDMLYRCSKATCGAFFSIFPLWLRHMSVRHNCLFASCPHCPDDQFQITLNEFQSHFELHRRHLFVCFHCGEARLNGDLLHEHLKSGHPDIQKFRTESIPFNLSYSYYVLIKEDIHPNRLEFLLNFREILMNRWDLWQIAESQKVVKKWKVAINELWLDGYPHYFKQYLLLKCSISECNFFSHHEREILEHLRSHEQISADCEIRCRRCNFQTTGANRWHMLFEHVEMHSSNLYICCVCNFYHFERKKLALHTKQKHNCRDVPIISLWRSESSTEISIAFIFASAQQTFSGIFSRNCFCCTRSDLNMQTYARHLKRYHHLKLQYYCELCDAELKLVDSKEHFSDLHPAESLRIRCELASKYEISVTSLMPFKISLKTKKSSIKEEYEECHSDDSVVELDEEDLIFAQASRALSNESASTNKIKCVDINNLINTSRPRPSGCIAPVGASIESEFMLSEGNKY